MIKHKPQYHYPIFTPARLPKLSEFIDAPAIPATCVHDAQQFWENESEVSNAPAKKLEDLRGWLEFHEYFEREGRLFDDDDDDDDCNDGNDSCGGNTLIKHNQPAVAHLLLTRIAGVVENNTPEISGRSANVVETVDKDGTQEWIPTYYKYIHNKSESISRFKKQNIPPITQMVVCTFPRRHSQHGVS